MKKLQLKEDIIYVFDKEYNDYKAFKKFSEAKTVFVTRIKDNAVYDIIEEQEIEENIHNGVIEDLIIEVVVKEDINLSTLKLFMIGQPKESLKLLQIFLK